MISSSASPCLRGELEAAGFVVARRPFRSGSESPHVHHMQRGGLTWETRHEWGELVSDGERPFNRDSTEERDVDKSLGPFVNRCLAAGCTLTDDLDRAVDYGNRFVEFECREYLAVEACELLIDRQFRDHRLEDVVQSLQRAQENAESDPLRPSAPSAVTKPFISMRDAPLTFSGARHQSTLF